jgi:hypothetical protein
MYVSANAVSVPDGAATRRTAYLYGGSYIPLNVDTDTMFADEEELTPLTYGSNSYSRYTTAYYKNTSNTSEVIKATNTGYLVAGSTESGNQASVVVGRADGLFNSVILTSGETAKYDNVYLYSNMNGSTYLIGDSDNGLEAGTSKTFTNGNNKSTTSTVISSSNYSRYNTVREQFLKSLTVYSDGSKDRLIYNGMHFADGISASSSINGTDVSIEGTTYQSYKLLNSSFNFHVSGTGFITAIVANVLGDGSTTASKMFQLYKIKRTNDTTSDKKTSTFSNSDVVQIVNSYGITDSKGKLTYVELVDSNNTTTTYGTKGTSDSVLKYSASWYTNTTLQDYSMYYIEIPVVEGDYAIGCLNNKGAYFMYLDIGANGSGSEGEKDKDEDTVTYVVKDVNFVTSLPVGDWSKFPIITIQIDITDTLKAAACFYFLRVNNGTDTMYCYYSYGATNLTVKDVDIDKSITDVEITNYYSTTDGLNSDVIWTSTTTTPS